MLVTTSYKPTSRAAWRAWLEQYHQTAHEIWLVLDDRSEARTVSYLDAVEEAICFGWIDSIQKRISNDERAQRFSVRKQRSNWTELNKERARRLIRLGLMTDAGRATLPDLSIAFTIAEDIVVALQQEPVAWSNFLAFPELYQRVRIGYVEDVRKNRSEFELRLRNLVKKTASKQMFGNWNDGSRLS